MPTLGGGSLEGRARLLRETVRAVRSAVPSRFVVGVRLSPDDFGNTQGLDLDESLQVARWLCEDGIDFLHLSLWNAQANTRKRPSEHPLPLFRRVVLPEVPIIAAGGVWSRADAEDLLDKGATAVALGRAAILNPDWPNRIEQANREPRRPPMTVAELAERGVSEGFASYLRRWNGFVADTRAVA